MHEGSVEPEKRIAAWRALREAKAAMEELIADAVRMNDTRPMYEKLKKWLGTVGDAEKEVGNLISDEEPFTHLLELRRIAVQLRQLGQRKTDSIAQMIERADGHLMDV